MLVMLFTVMLIVVAANTAGALAQPQIGIALQVGPAETGWVVFGYSATFAVATSLYGGIAASFGPIRALMAGMSLLAVGSLLAGIAPSMEVLIASRLLQGLGAGAVPTLSIVLIAGVFDGIERTRALGVMVASIGVGQALGPLLGGVLVEFFGWRAAVAAGLGILPAIVILPRIAGAQRRITPLAPRVDVVGAFLVVATVLSAAIVLNRLPVVGIAALTVGAFAALAVSGLSLGYRILRMPSGFIPLEVVRHPDFRRLVPMAAAGLSAYLGSITLIPVFASQAYGIDGLLLGILLLPAAGGTAVASLNAGRIEARLGPVWTTRISLTALGTGPLLLASGAVSDSMPIVLVALGVLGLGFGALNAPLLTELTDTFRGSAQPVAVGLYYLGFVFGGVVGAAVSSAIVQPRMPFSPGDSVSLVGFVTAELLLSVTPLAMAVFGVRRASRATEPFPQET
jgi:DHA2 family metal-tetracycline-proton antiporter-like MFS transporter